MRALATSLFLLIAPSATHAGDVTAQGHRLIDAGRYSEAVTTFRGRATAHSNDAEAWHGLAKALLATGMVEEAHEAVTRAVTLVPNSSRFHRLRGEILGRRAEKASLFKQLGIARDAVEALELAVEHDPDDLEARDSLFEYYVQAPGIAGGGKGKAREQIEIVMARNRAWGLRLEARFFEETGGENAAIAAYRGALALEPDHRKTRLALASLLLDEARYDEAAEHLRKLDPPAEGALGIEPLVLHARGRLAAEGGFDLDAGGAALLAYAKRGIGAYEPSMKEVEKLLARIGRRRNAAIER